MMRPHRSHRRLRRLIHRLFTVGVSSAARQRLFASLETCKELGDEYHQYQRVESALCNTDAPYTALAIERVGHALLDEWQGALTPASSRLRRWRIPALLTGGLGIGAALLLVVMLWPWRESDRRVLDRDIGFSPVSLTAKGVYPGSAESQIGVRVFEVSTSGQRVWEEKKLNIADIITFTYTRVKKNSGYLALFGVQETGEIRWYYPDYGERKSIPIQGDRVDEPLGDGIALAVNHRPGWLRVVALFSDTPIEVEAIEAAVQALRSRPDGLRKLLPLSLAGAPRHLRQYTTMVEIDKGDNGDNSR
jgi:hypothetical protein